MSDFEHFIGDTLKLKAVYEPEEDDAANLTGVTIECGLRTLKGRHFPADAIDVAEDNLSFVATWDATTAAAWEEGEARLGTRLTNADTEKTSLKIKTVNLKQGVFA